MSYKVGSSSKFFLLQRKRARDSSFQRLITRLLPHIEETNQAWVDNTPGKMW